MKKQTRRKFLASAGLGGASAFALHPFATVLESLFSSVIRQAYAQETGQALKKYLFIQQYGAPPRWMYDLFLNPYNQPGFVATRSFGTKYHGSSTYTNIAHALVSLKGIHVPWMWQFPVAKAGGGYRPMTELLDHLIHIRGYSSGNPAHLLSAIFRFLAPGSPVSTQALVADKSSAPFSVITAGNTLFQFRSREGKLPITLPLSSTMLDTLFQPFMIDTPASFKNKNEAIGDSILAASDTIDEYIKSMYPDVASLQAARKDAKELLRFAADDLSKQWNSLKAKYADLVRRSFSHELTMKGINDRPIGVAGKRDATYRVANSAAVAGDADLRTLLGPSTRVQWMAELFALAEYVMVKGISDTLAIGVRGVENVLVNGKPMFWLYDEHLTGKMPSLLVNIMQFRALSACMLELFTQLKAAKIFDQTLVEVSSEFNRSPRRDGIGSDHGFGGASTALYSGSFSGPMVIGNIKKNPNLKETYAGSWGDGAGIEKLGGQKLSHEDVLATIAFLVGQPSPLNSHSSLLTRKDGKIVPAIELARLV